MVHKSLDVANPGDVIVVDGAVARRAQLDRPELGPQRLGRVPVAMVAGLAGRRLPGRVEVLGQLRAHRYSQASPAQTTHSH
jgi:hypothetical protein